MKIRNERVDVYGVTMVKRMNSRKRKWCTVDREFYEDGEVIGWRAIQYNAVLSYTPYVAYSQTIRRRGKNIYVAKE